MQVKTAVAGLLAANSTFWLVAAVLLLAVVYLSAAAYLGLQAIVGAALAALLTGAGVLLLALAGAAAIALAVRPPQRPQRESLPAPLEQADSALRPVVGDSAADWIRANPVPALTGAIAAGALLAFSPSMRSLVLRTVAPIAIRGAARTAKKLSDSGDD